MGALVCPGCGWSNAPGSRYCTRCGNLLGSRGWFFRVGAPYSQLRFQIDPVLTAPVRDPRWIMMVLGFALAVVGVLFLAVSAIVGGAVAASQASCSPSGGTGCTSFDPGTWFGWIGAPLLGVGILLAAVGLVRAIR